MLEVLSVLKQKIHKIYANLLTVENMKQTTTDIANYVKGRLKMDDNVQHERKYILLHLKSLRRKRNLAIWFIRSGQYNDDSNVFL